MNQQVLSQVNYRDQWLALLDRQGVGSPKSLQVIEVPAGLIQATLGEPSGRISLEGAPGNVLMFNLSPVQGLRQTREGRSFTSDVLHGEMTLMPAGVPSQWSWNSACDRLDVAISLDIFADGGKLEVVDRFLFRDPELEVICRSIYREVSRNGAAERLYVESLLMKMAVVLLGRHSTAAASEKVLSSGGLTRIQAKRLIDYIESNLSQELTLRKLASLLNLSVHHFARMFKQTIGLAPYHYVLERRVERAKALLRAGKASLVEISLSTGFDSQSHLSSTFRRIVGATPTEFQGCNSMRLE